MILKAPLVTVFVRHVRSGAITVDGELSCTTGTVVSTSRNGALTLVSLDWSSREHMVVSKKSAASLVLGVM